MMGRTELRSPPPQSGRVDDVFGAAPSLYDVMGERPAILQLSLVHQALVIAPS